MRDPDISVIVLTYNQADTIGRAIDSILAQEAAPFSYEIVIGDDGSSDNTREICEGYQRRYPGIIRMISPAPNKGVVDNYFDTLAACRGRYIADCAGDDYWIDPQRLRRLAGLLESQPEVALAYGSWEEVSPSGEVVRRCHPYGRGDEPVVCDGSDLLEPLLAHKMPLTVHLSAALYRLSVLKRAMDEDRGIVVDRRFGCEDLPILAALLARGKAAYIPDEILAYTVGGSTISNPDNIGRALQFYSATVRCTAILSRHYGVESKDLDRYFTSRIVYIAKLARHIATPEAIRMVKETAEFTGQRMPLLARLLLIYARIRG